MSKYSQKLIDHAKQSGTDALNTASKRAIKKPEEATGDLIGNKILDRLKKKVHNRIIQKEILNIIEKYTKKNTYLQIKDRKLLII